MNYSKRVPQRKHIAHTPIVIQMENTECGAACLDMVLAYYGLFLPLSQIRSDCDINRDGVNAAVIAKIADQYGLKAHGFRYSQNAIVNKATYPCMILWEQNHFVILNGFKNNKAYINDPACGQLSVPINDFMNSYSGFCMLFEKTDRFVYGGKKVSILSYAYNKLKGTKKTLLYMTVMTVVFALISLITPAFSHIFINNLQRKSNSEWLYILIVIMAGVTSVKLITDIAGNINRMKISGRLSAIGASDYFYHLLKLPVSFYSNRSVGDLQSRQEENETMAISLIDAFLPLCFNIVLMILYLTVMLHYSVFLTFIGIASIVINIFLSGIFAPKRENISRILQQKTGRMYGITGSGISMIETIKSGGFEQGYFERWADAHADVVNQKTEYSKLDAVFCNVTVAITSISNILVLFFGVYLVIKGELSQGAIMAFQGYLSSFFSPVRLLLDTKNGLTEMKGKAERLDDVMKHSIDPLLKNDAELDSAKCKPLSGKIAINNVSFGYSKFSPYILNDISININLGERVAFVGKSGCGKSTLAKLLSGLYVPTEGQILYDNCPIDSINRSVFTGSVSMVSQNIVLFDNTVADNIRLFDNSIEDIDVINAAKDACIHDEIMLRSGGYEHHMRENGKDYSGGQRQRIEIARALAINPQILILDEATSALDSITEREIINSVKKRKITTIIIAHRLSAIRDCDRIYVIDEGRIVENGTHDELIKANGIYKQLLSNEQEAI